MEGAISSLPSSSAVEQVAVNTLSLVLYFVYGKREEKIY